MKYALKAGFTRFHLFPEVFNKEVMKEEVRAGTEAEECRMRKLSCFPEQLEQDLRPYLSGSLLQVPVLPFVFTLLRP